MRHRVGNSRFRMLHYLGNDCHCWHTRLIKTMNVVARRNGSHERFSVDGGRGRHFCFGCLNAGRIARGGAAAPARSGHRSGTTGTHPAPSSAGHSTHRLPLAREKTPMLPATKPDSPSPSVMFTVIERFKPCIRMSPRRHQGLRFSERCSRRFRLWTKDLSAEDFG